MGHYHPNIHLENNLNSISTADTRNSGGGESNHAAKNSKNTKNTKKNNNNDINNHDNNNNNSSSSSACELTMMNQPSDNILSSRVFIEKINESHKPFLKLLLSDEAVMREISTRSVIRMDQFEAVFGPTFKHLVQHNEQERFHFSDSDNNTPTPQKKHPMTMTWWILRTRGTKGLGAIGLHRDIENRCITVEQLVRPEIQNTTIAAEALYTLTKVYEDLNRLNGTLRDFYDYKLIVTSSVGRSMTDLMQAFQFEKKMIPLPNGEAEKLQYETKTGHFFSNVVYRAKSQLIQQVEYISLPCTTTITTCIDNGENEKNDEKKNNDDEMSDDDDENGENGEKVEMMIAPDRIDLIRYTQVQGRRLNPFPYRGLIQFEFDNTWKREKMVHQLPALGCNKQHSIGHVTLRIPTTTSHTSERNNNNGDGGDDDEYHSKIQNWLDCYLCVYLVKEASSSSSSSSAAAVVNNKPSIIYQAKRNKRDGYPLVFSQFGFKRSSNNSNKNDLISEIKLQPKSQSLDENGKHARVFCLIELWHHLTKLDQFETDHFYTHSEDRRKKSMNSSSSCNTTTSSSAAAVNSSGGSSPPRAASSISTSYAHNTNSHYGMKKNASAKSKNRSMDASNMMNVGNNSGGGANHALSAPIAIVQPPGLNIKNMSIPSVNVSGVGANNHNPMVIVGGTGAAHGHQAANSTSGSPPKQQQHSPRSPVLSNNNHSHLFNHFGYDTNDGISLDIHHNNGSGNHSNYGYHHSNHGNNNGSNGSNYLHPYQQPSHRVNNGGHYSGGPVAASAQRDYNNHHQHLHPNHAHAAPHMHVHTHHAHQHQHQHNGSVVDNAHHHVHHHHHHNNYQNQSYCPSRHHHHHFQWSDMTSELTCSHHDHCQVPMNNHEQDNCSMMKDDNDSSSSRSSFSSASFSSNKAPLHLILGLANENEMESNSGRNFKCPCPWNTRNNPPYHVLLNALPPPSICSSNSCCPSIITPSSSSTCLAPSSCSSASSTTTTSPPALSSPSSPPTSAPTGVDAFHAHHSHPLAHHRSDPLCCPIPAPTPTLAVNCSSIAAPHGLQQQQPQLINTEKVTSPSTGILPSIQSLLHMVDHHSTAPVSVTNVASQSQMSPPTGDPSTPLTPFASLRISCVPPTNAPSAHYQSEPFVPHSHAIAHHHMDKNHHPMMHHPQPYGQQNVHHGAPHNHFPQQNHYKYMKQ